MSKEKKMARQRAKEQREKEQANKVVKWIVVCLVLLAVAAIIGTTIMMG